MVGVSLRPLRRAVRWIGGLRARQRMVGAALILALVGGAIWLALVSRDQARLLRTDPDVASADPALMRFAVGRGHGLYDHHCAACHGAKGLGDMAKGVPNLTDKDWLYGDGLASDIEQVVLYGIRDANPRTWRLADMPAYARKVPYSREPIPPLSPGDIKDVIAFLGSLHGESVPPDAAVRGAKIYSDRGGCYDCHGSDAHGDPAIGGPNLTDNIWLYGGDPKTLFNTIAYGRAGYCPAWDKRLSPAQIRETVLYVYSLSHPLPSKTSPRAQ